MSGFEFGCLDTVLANYSSYAIFGCVWDRSNPTRLLTSDWVLDASGFGSVNCSIAVLANYSSYAIFGCVWDCSNPTRLLTSDWVLDASGFGSVTRSSYTILDTSGIALSKLGCVWV
ncbi:3941_t:CDS:2 [Paraglomus brasilianum]|uniref:3941_t:CDS:1 n=1 Tax=Paraglomus brasilianum TaxID=144538 RepID=A0A9N9FGF3_9GLOM|nr:3941_t:CDS:2 [Paraglomus brasilianum]